MDFHSKKNEFAGRGYGSLTTKTAADSEQLGFYVVAGKPMGNLAVARRNAKSLVTLGTFKLVPRA
jgi:hypothetical protein